MNTGLLILLVAALAAIGLGLYRRHVDGRFVAGPRVAEPATTSEVEEVDLETVAARPSRSEPQRPSRVPAWASLSTALPDARLGAQATLVQFSSAFCAPCRTTRVVLADIAERHDGVAHLEIDAEQHLDLVRELHVRRTPTTLVLDAEGRELTRAAGAPRREQVLAALADVGEPR